MLRQRDIPGLNSSTAIIHMAMENREQETESVWRAAQKVFPDFDVVAAYLYGSYARGEEHEGSDVDVAVYFENYDIDKLLRVGRRMREEADVSREIDVRALNRSDPMFSFEVIREGELVYEADPAKRVDVEQAIERRYHDMKPLVEEYRTEMKRRTSQHG